MEQQIKFRIKVALPKYSSVNNLILKYSSLVVLNTGAKFRVCNICGVKLDANLSDQHAKHLKTHSKTWKSYKNKVCESLRESIENDVNKVEKTDNETKTEDFSSSSSSDSEEVASCYNVVDTLGPSFHNRPPPWTVFEKKLLSRFTYDKNPVKDFREFSDIHVISMCNALKIHQINEFIEPGSDLNLLDPNRLYVPDSQTINKIARMLCEKQCYFNPGECFFDDNHTFNFKDLLKKELHEKLNPHFENILNGKSKKDVVLKYDGRNHPKVDELCEEVGFTTHLEYNMDGYVDLNYDIFCRQLWDNDTPLFVLEEKKVLDIFLTLLLAASELYATERDKISDKYAQNEPGLNKPVLSIMHHGPGIQGGTNKKSEHCDTERDDSLSSYQTYISHKKCKNYTDEDHWMYKHNENEESTSNEPDCIKNLTNSGPASLLNQSVVYPCDRGHWHPCECQSCTLIRNFNCTNHKIHMKHNIKKCFIREAVDCDEHHIEHPENFQHGDIVIEKNVLYHNRQLLKGGRNYRREEIVLAGLKCKCNKCRKKILDHFKHHHVLHAHCEVCLYESKTSEDARFWDKVCKICGKKYENKHLKEVHILKHDKNKMQTCEYCDKHFVSKYTYRRHLIEQHDIHQHANNGPYDGTRDDENFKYRCTICMKEFKYERNVYAHMYSIHYKHFACECKICGRNITSKSNLKRHLSEQHDFIDIGREVPRESLQIFPCDICMKQFKRKTTLIEHMEIHKEKRTRYQCDQCEETFYSVKNLRSHKNLHSNEWKVYPCNICKAEFLRSANLKEHMKTHVLQRQEFKCRKCSKIFLAQRTLTRHMIMYH